MSSLSFIALTSIPTVLWSGLTFALGIATKSLIDTYIQRREADRKFAVEKHTAFLEQQLSRFYWPLYLHLQKDNLIWQRLIERDEDPDSPASRLSKQIESGVILPNHKGATDVIETSLHLAGTAEVIDAALRYVRHVKVYETLRAAGIKGDPISFGEPYPKDFFPLIERHAQALQSEYDQLIRQSASSTPR